MCDLPEWELRLDIAAHEIVPWYESPVGNHMTAEGIHA